MLFIINRVKILILSILGAIRRALCCFRRKRGLQDEQEECLTQVLVTGTHERLDAWDTRWGDDDRNKRPQTIQDHIQLYREKIAQANIPPPPDQENEIVDHFFQEMTPQNITQKRVVINSSSNKQNPKSPESSRLSVSDNVSSGVNDLGEWMEDSTSGWDEQNINPTDYVREQKRLKREAIKNQNSGLGRKLKT